MANTVTQNDQLTGARGGQTQKSPQSINLIRVDGRQVKYQPVASFAQLHQDDVELHEAQQDVLTQIDEYFGLVAEIMYDEPDLQEELLNRLQKAKERTLQATEQVDDADPAWLLGRAQFYVRRVHIAIARTQRAREEERRLRLFVPGLFVLYIVMIVGTIMLVGATQGVTPDGIAADNADKFEFILLPVIRVPVSVLVWAALGSVAAILYRFYTVKQGLLADEIRWLIARPLIGIIMGALTYIAIASGLFILGSATDVNGPTPNPHLMWVIAFFGGFSDRFFGTLIDTVMGYLPNHEVQSQEVVTKEASITVQKSTTQVESGAIEEDDLPQLEDDQLLDGKTQEQPVFNGTITSATRIPQKKL